MKILLVLAFNLISICVADIVYHEHEPIYIYDDGYPHYYGPHNYVKNEAPSNSFADELREYGKIFVETFKKSYKDLNKPYVVEKLVPYPVPVPVEHPIFIRSRPKILYKKIIYKNTLK